MGRADSKSEPSKAKDKEPATVPRNEFAALPKNEAEYFAATATWINELDDADEGEKRWLSEKSLRNKSNTGSDAREELAERLKQKQREIRDADRN
jgi:hypothetical protein